MKRTSTSLLIATLGAMSTALLAAQPIFTHIAQSQPQESPTAAHLSPRLDVGATQSDISEPPSISKSEPIGIPDSYLLRYLHDIETKRSILLPIGTPN